MKKVIIRGKRSKTLSKVKLVKNISKNLQTFLEISPMQKEVLPSHKLLRPCIWVINSFQIKGKELLKEKLPESIEPSKFVSHRTRMSGEFDSREDSHSTKLE